MSPIAKNRPEAAELKYDVFWGVGHDKREKLPSPKVHFLDQVFLDPTICTYHYHTARFLYVHLSLSQLQTCKNELIGITVPETACYRYHPPGKLSTGGGLLWAGAGRGGGEGAGLLGGGAGCPRAAAAAATSARPQQPPSS
jgi:hypothetical protein